MSKARATTNGKYDVGEPTLVPLPEIQFDPAYQRLLIPVLVKKIETQYDPLMVGACHLSARGNTLYCVDGQHRIVAMRNLGLTHIPAIIHRGLNQVEEAQLFIKLNKERRSLGAWDWYHAEITARIPEALDIYDVISKSRYTMDREGSRKFNIEAVASVRRIYRLGGKGNLAKTLEVMGHHWYGKEAATKRNAMEPLALFLRTQRDDPAFEEKRLAEVLNRIGPSQFIRDGANWVAEEYHTQSNVGWLAQYLQHLYNQRLSGPKKLRRVIKQAGKQR